MIAWYNNFRAIHNKLIAYNDQSADTITVLFPEWDTDQAFFLRVMRSGMFLWIKFTGI